MGGGGKRGVGRVRGAGAGAAVIRHVTTIYVGRERDCVVGGRKGNDEGMERE